MVASQILSDMSKHGSVVAASRIFKDIEFPSLPKCLLFLGLGAVCLSVEIRG